MIGLFSRGRMVIQAMHGRMRDRGFSAAVVLFTTVAIPLVLVPSGIFFANVQEFTVSLGVIHRVLLPAAGLLWVPLYSIFLILPDRIYRYVLAGAVALAFMFWFQANFLVWDYGVLDGGTIDWFGQWKRGLIDSLAWILLISSALRFNRAVVKHAKLLSVLLVATQVATIVTAAFTAQEPVSAHNYSLDTSHQFVFSSRKNVILLVLDSFQGDVMQEILKKHPKYRKVLNGFTYYRNAASGYSKTYASIPLLLTGEWYQNDIPIQRFLRRSYNRSSITARLMRQGWRVDLFPFVDRTLYFSEDIASNMVPAIKPADAYREAGRTADLGLFRSTPHFIKSFWLNEYRWRIAPVFRMVARGVKDSLSAVSEIDHPHPAVSFVKSLAEYGRVSSDRPAFKMYHLNIPHEPFFLTEKLEMKRLPSGRKGFVRHSVASLEVARLLLGKLRELGIYDSTMILLISDHGGGEYLTGVNYQNLPRKQGIPDSKATTIPGMCLESALPLVLIKPFGATGDLKTSDAPVSLGDIHRTILEETGLEDEKEAGRNILTIAEDERRIRRYLFYQFRGWKRDYLPTMTEYELDGHSWLPQNWRATGAILEPAASVGLKSVTSEQGYAPGMVAKFKETTPHQEWLLKGWGAPEEHATWSNGREAILRVPLEQPFESSVQARFLFRAFTIENTLPAQTVRLSLNGETLTTWRADAFRWYQVAVPASLVRGQRTLEFVFSLPDAASPADNQLSMDARLLGIALTCMVIDAGDERESGDPSMSNR